ncbi:MAG: hypothetical protein VX000_17965, partial [Myxococcota bacterium]|nr:hypothetical protein [Myxococcota bacterium]
MLTPAAALLALAVVGTADAAPARRVLVANFEARNQSMAATALQLPDELEQVFAEVAQVEVVTLDQLPPISDMPAVLYASSCPSGQFIGCAFVLGQAGGVDLVVAGAVEELREGIRAEVHILDVDRSEDVLAFQVDFGRSDVKLFADGVGAVVAAVGRGEVELGSDIRARVDPGAGAARERDQAVARRQIDTLEREIGDVDTVDRRRKGTIVKEKLSIESLAEDIDKEGAKPWERLDMTMQDDLRYRNSDANLLEWRQWMEGRRQQLVLRPYLGFANGPASYRYYGQYLQAQEDFRTLETYAWQTSRNRSGVTYGMSVAYGILPTLEVGLTVGGVLGEFSYEIQKQTEGQEPTQLPAEGEGVSTMFFGPEFLVVLMPTSVLRPVFGGGVTWRRGPAIGSFLELPPDLPGFPANTAVLTHALVGGEVRLSNSLDLFLHLPVTMLVGGTASRQQYDGEGLMVRNASPTAPGAVGAGVHVGFQ